MKSHLPYQLKSVFNRNALFYRPYLKSIMCVQREMDYLYWILTERLSINIDRYASKDEHVDSSESVWHSFVFLHAIGRLKP